MNCPLDSLITSAEQSVRLQKYTCLILYVILPWFHSFACHSLDLAKHGPNKGLRVS